MEDGLEKGGRIREKLAFVLINTCLEKRIRSKKKLGNGFCHLPLAFSVNVKTKFYTDDFFKSLKAKAATFQWERGHWYDM